jgi:hypothetical protein
MHRLKKCLLQGLAVSFAVCYGTLTTVDKAQICNMLTRPMLTMHCHMVLLAAQGTPELGRSGSSAGSLVAAGGRLLSAAVAAPRSAA